MVKKGSKDMEEKRTFGVNVYLHLTVEADTIEEAFHKTFNATKDAIHFVGDSESEIKQTARVLIAGQEDEVEATLEAEWKNGILSKITTEREVW